MLGLLIDFLMPYSLVPKFLLEISAETIECTESNTPNCWGFCTIHTGKYN